MADPRTVPGLDFAWGSKPYDTIKRQGYRFVMRYVSFDAGKDPGAAEKAEWWKRGIAVGLVFESTAGRALKGHAAGVADARHARSRANALGLHDIPVYFAVDFDATDAQKPTIAAYLAGAASVLGKARVGVYGSFHVINYMHHHDVCRYFWQTYAWSGGLVHPAAHILQYRNGASVGGLSCDLNKAKPGDIGVRGPKPPAPKHPKARRQLRQIRVVARFLGWLPGLKKAGEKRKAVIRGKRR